MPETSDPGPNGPYLKLAQPRGSARRLLVAIAAGALARAPRSLDELRKDAAEKYRIAVGLDPESWAAYDGWGTVLQNDGDLPGAIEKFRLAIETDEGAPQPHYHLIEGLHLQGEQEARR